MGTTTPTVWRRVFERRWIQLRLVALWLRAVRRSSLNLLVALCLIEPLGCLLHCSVFSVTASSAASSHSMGHHGSHADHISDEASSRPGLPSPTNALVAVVDSTGTCNAHHIAGSPISDPAPTDTLFLHAHLIALALGVVVNVGLVWQQALLRPTPPPPRWFAPQLRRPPKFLGTPGSCRLA